MTRWNRELILTKVHAFIDATDELTEKAWRSWAARNGAPASGSVTFHLGAKSFSHAICEVAAASASDRTFTWPICPAGVRHLSEDYWSGTPTAWRAGECSVCEVRSARQAERLATAPTFAERFPEFVPYLHDPGDATTRAGLVSFRCGSCGYAPIPWSPGRGGVPQCQHCRDANGQPPGSIVLRRGGGMEVPLEGQLADELVRLGVPATASYGVVLRPRSYVVEIIKPDVLVLDPPVAVELDHADHEDNHHLTPEGEADDQRRDDLLAAVGWRALRIRRPDAPSTGEWPWRIETTSVAPKKLAKLVVDAIANQASET